MTKIAMISGITGQDGSYLAELLLKKGYEVIGLMRRVSTEPPYRLRYLKLQPFIDEGKLVLECADVTDVNSIIRVLKKHEPVEFYNLAAQSHVGIAFDQPYETTSVNYLGVINILTAIKALDMTNHIRLYQASTSEMFGGTARRMGLQKQNELTPFWPLSPYGIAKLAAHHLVVMARTTEHGHWLRAACGILFNHESELRGENFVTRKITRALTRIKHGLQKKLELGNLDALRDWGYAKDYVEAMWLMLQQQGAAEKWQDFVVATNEMHSVRDFVNASAREIGWEMEWEGEGRQEKGYVQIDGERKLIVEVNPEFYRENDVHLLRGDASKARELLQWKPKTNFDQLVSLMVAHDLRLAEAEKNW
ncbi:MAG: GDP-mannose 4,6-dehydratase [Patescibacteria group bacterium]